MATIDKRTGAVGAVPSYTSTGRMWSAQVQVDFSVDNASSTDVVQLFDVPSGVLVQGLVVEVETAEGGVCTATGGVIGDPDGFFATTQIDLNATAGTIVSSAALANAYQNGLTSSSDEVITITLENDADTAVATFTAYGVDCTPRSSL